MACSAALFAMAGCKRATPGPYPGDAGEEPSDAGATPARAGEPHRGTFGSVRDASTGAPIAGAVVRFYTIDPGAESTGAEELDFAVSTLSAPGGQFVYEAAFPRGLTRIRVDAPGYEALVTYRNHLYDRQCRGGPCSQQDFELWPEGVVHETPPDLVPNPSYVQQGQVTLTSQCDGRSGVAVCLRFTVGVANFGAGDLFLSAPTDDLTQVTQHVFDSTGAMRDEPLAGDFTHGDGHEHVHLGAWSRFALRPIDPGCDTLSTASRCSVVREATTATECVGNTAFVDDELEPNRQSYDCVVGDGRFEQGLSAGAMSVHTRDFVDQLVDVTGLPSGDYWLEAHVNPEATVVESTYENNVVRGRYRLDLPGCGNGVPEFPEACEGDDLRGVTCETLDERFDGGVLACTDQCGLDRTGCTRAQCSPVDLGATLGLVARGDNTTARNTAEPKGCPTPRGTGKDVSFLWTAPEAGRFNFRDRLGNMYLFVRDETCDGEELACETRAPARGVDVDLESGQGVVVFLDVLPERLGEYQLEVLGPL